MIANELPLMEDLIKELADCALVEEVSRKQKSITLWLKEGYWNTTFFHWKGNANWSYIATIALKELLTDVRLSDDPKKIQDKKSLKRRLDFKNLSIVISLKY